MGRVKGVEMGAVQKRFALLKQKIQQLDVDARDILPLISVTKLKHKPSLLPWKKIFVAIGLVTFLFSCFCYVSYRYHWPISRKTLFHYGSYITLQDQTLKSCFIKLDTYMLSSVRPIIDCNMCKGVNKIDRVPSTINPDELMEKYIKPIRPVLIEGSFNISATGKTFDFNFFKTLYKNASSSVKNAHPLCEFENYLTMADTVQDLLNMKNEHANSPGGDDPNSWYVGWANCDRDVTEELGKYFNPYFLPSSVEPSKTFWMYMGSPGHGFVMHIDPRLNPQWQTQVHGRKKYLFQVPSECYFKCNYSEMEVIMNEGDTLIFHAGKWYHETENIGDTIMVALGTSFQ